MNEPHMAPWWFPANDHPRDKATFDIQITVPAGTEVVANGVRSSGRCTAPGHRATGAPSSRWRPTSRSSRPATSGRPRRARRIAVYVAVSKQLGRRPRAPMRPRTCRRTRRSSRGSRRARRLPVLHHRRPGDQPARRLRAGEPDPADVPRRSGRADARLVVARAGPPVVRRLGRGAAAGATSGSTRASRPFMEIRPRPRPHGGGPRRTGCATATTASARARRSGSSRSTTPAPAQHLRRTRSTTAARWRCRRCATGSARPTSGRCCGPGSPQRAGGNGSVADFEALAEHDQRRGPRRLLRRLAAARGQARRRRPPTGWARPAQPDRQAGHAALELLELGDVDGHHPQPARLEQLLRSAAHWSTSARSSPSSRTTWAPGSSGHGEERRSQDAGSSTSGS